MKPPTKSIFKDRVKEAQFWEKNFDEAWAKGKPVNVRFAKNLSETINIRLEPNVLNGVRYLASKKGLGPTQLIRTWVMEKLRSEPNFRQAET